LFDQRLHLDPSQCVQGTEWFVKSQDAGMADQRPRQGDALLLPTGQDVRPLRFPPRQADLG